MHPAGIDPRLKDPGIDIRRILVVQFSFKSFVFFYIFAIVGGCAEILVDIVVEKATAWCNLWFIFSRKSGVCTPFLTFMTSLSILGLFNIWSIVKYLSALIVLSVLTYLSRWGSHC